MLVTIALSLAAVLFLGWVVLALGFVTIDLVRAGRDLIREMDPEWVILALVVVAVVIGAFLLISGAASLLTSVRS